MRAQLGFETQRQWSDRAIERTTPCLFGIFSLVVIMGKVLYPQEIPIRQAKWYEKDQGCSVLPNPDIIQDIVDVQAVFEQCQTYVFHMVRSKNVERKTT